MAIDQLKYGLAVSVTPEAIKDHQIENPHGFELGEVVDLTADQESAFVFFPKRGSKSLWHKSELVVAGASGTPPDNAEAKSTES